MTIEVDSTVVRSTQRPLIWTGLSEGDIIGIVVAKGALEKMGRVVN